MTEAVVEVKEVDGVEAAWLAVEARLVGDGPEESRPRHLPR